MYLTEKDLESLFNPSYFERGVSYFKSSKVIKVQANLKEKQIISIVKGNGSNRYNTRIKLDIANGSLLDVYGKCSCPVAINCKHVIASLLEYINNHQATEQSTGRWVNQLKEAQLEFFTRQPTTQGSSDIILYIVSINDYPSGKRICINTVKTRQRKDGSFGQSRPFTVKMGSQASYIRDEDAITLALLESLKSETGQSNAVLEGNAGNKVLQELINTGRCHWQDDSYPKLKLSETKSSRLSWHLKNDTTQEVRADQLSGDYILLPVLPVHYLNIKTGECGVLECGLPQKIASILVGSPSIAISEVEDLSITLEKEFRGLDIPLPIIPNIKPVDDINPIPVLHLYNEEIEKLYFDEDEDRLSIATLRFDYKGHIVSPLDDTEKFTHKVDSSFEVIKRNWGFEKDIIRTLDDIGLIADEYSLDDALQLDPVLIPETWLDFMLNHKQRLISEGWEIKIAMDFDFQFDEVSDWYAQINQDSNDWFKLELGVDIDGESVNLLPFLVSYLDTLKGAKSVTDLQQYPDDFPLLFRQENGRLLHIPLAKVRHIIDTLVELYDPDSLDQDGNLELSRYHSRQLSALNNSQTLLKWSGGEAIRNFADKLDDFKGVVAVEPPNGLIAELRDYQKEGLSWLQFLREYDLGGILADDMGLGKTVQTLAHILIEKNENRAVLPSLVVAPTSLMVNWSREIARFTPGLSVMVLQGADRKEKFSKINECDIVLTTYPLLSRDTDILLQQKWHIVVLDEAQHIKNPKSKAAQTACQLTTNHRICLTGTPMENHLGELWSQFHFLMPGILGDEKRFRRLFRVPIEKQQDAMRQSQLRKRIAPFLLRREKTQVAAELPPKTEILTEVELEGPQRDLYETIRVSMHSKVIKAIESNGISRSQIIILDALLKLRQVCCHPQLLKIPSAKKVSTSAKLSQLMEMLPEMVEEGRRILLFSQFTSMLAIIEKQLQKHNLDYVQLTGQTRNREIPIDTFQSGKVPIFLISLKAGGTGLNLTAADTVIHYDPWWNPAAENQATDRAHRIGQDKPVFVYKMITAGTVEEKIAEMQVRKQALADAIYSNGNTGGQLGLEDLDALFEPIV